MCFFENVCERALKEGIREFVGSGSITVDELLARHIFAEDYLQIYVISSLQKGAFAGNLLQGFVLSLFVFLFVKR